MTKKEEYRKKYPHGELLCENVGGKVYSFSPDKVIKWLEKNKLIGEVI